MGELVLVISMHVAGASSGAKQQGASSGAKQQITARSAHF